MGCRRAYSRAGKPKGLGFRRLGLRARGLGFRVALTPEPFDADHHMEGPGWADVSEDAKNTADSHCTKACQD